MKKTMQHLIIIALATTVTALSINAKAETEKNDTSTTATSKKQKTEKEALRAARKKERLPVVQDNAGNMDVAPVVRSGPVLPNVSAADVASSSAYATNDIYVERIVVNNQTIFSEVELATIVSPYEKRKVTPDELHELRNQLSKFYVARGYINSGVIIPDQRIENGLLALQAVEGQLSAIEIEGQENLSKAFVEQEIRMGARQPLNLDELKQSLRMFEQNAWVENVSAQLLPMNTYGESLLKIRIKESKPYQVSVDMNNYRASNIGEEQLRIGATYRNATKWGDEINGEFGLTDSVYEYALRYAMPIPTQPAKFDAYFARSVVDMKFSGFSMRANVGSSGAGVSYAFIKSVPMSVAASLRFDARSSETFLDGLPTGFTSGEDKSNGVSDTRVLTIAGQFNRNWERDRLTMQAGVKTGIGFLGATQHTDAPDGRFSALFGQNYLQHRLDSRLGYLNARFHYQYAFESLLPIEKMSVGGVATVRGYQDNEMLADNGINSSIEWRIPLNFEVPSQYLRNTTVFPFLDHGFSWDEHQYVNAPGSKARQLVSLGIGASTQIFKNLRADMSWGLPLTSADDNPYKGFNLAVSYRYPN